MAEEAEVIAPGSEAGAGENAQTQGAESASQEAGQSQPSEGTPVEGTPTNASSNGQPGRSNVDWALQRKIEKAVSKVLQSSLNEHLTPYLEKLQTAQNPPAAKTEPVNDTPDYNDLNGWIARRVNSLLEERLQKDLPKTLNSFKSEITGQITGQARMQEARNYLQSQKDIGTNELVLAEIRKVIEDNPIDFSDPVKGTQFAVDIWRKQKLNPNAPLKSHLSGLPGGAGAQPKREASIADIRALQDRLTQNLTMEEKEKLNKEIDALVFSK